MKNTSLIFLIFKLKFKLKKNLILFKVSLSTNNDNLNNQTKSIWIDAGIHAREWIAPATAMIILKKLVDGYNKDNLEIRSFIEKIDWYITIVLNPDGYEYSHTKVKNLI